MEERKDFILQIGQLNKKIDNARELTLNDDISSADYRLIKEQCDESITCREARLNELNTQNSVVLDIKTIVQEAVDSLLSLDKLVVETSRIVFRHDKVCYFLSKNTTRKYIIIN